VSCGARHTLAVTEEGEVYSFGLGHFGVLGRSFTPYEYFSNAHLASIGIEEDEVEAEQQQPAPFGQIDHLGLLSNLTLDDNSDQCIPKVIEALQGIKIVGAW